MPRGPIRRMPRPKAEVQAVMAVDELPYICITEEVGRFLRCTPEQVQRKAASGELRGYKEGQEWRFRRDDVIAYLNKKVVRKEVSA